MLYANYLRNKMRHLVKTLFSSGYPLKIISKFEKKAVDYTIHGNTETGVGDLDSESGKYKITLRNAGRNSIIYPYAINMSKTTGGVTFVDNGHGVITGNGTATSNISLVINTKNLPLEVGEKYILSGCPNGGSENTYKIFSYLYKNGTTTATSNISDIGGGAIIDTAQTGYDAMRMYIRIMRDVVCDNFVFRPMLSKCNTGENLIPYPYYSSTQTTSGVDFTDNGDGSVTVNGTAEATIYYILCRDLKNIDITKKYVLSGGAENISIYLALYQGSTWKKEIRTPIIDFATCSDIEYNRIVIAISVMKDVTVDNVTIKPVLEPGETILEYEPYRAAYTADIYRAEPLKSGESISRKTDNLPDLQLYEGENNITADTEVKPTAIDVKYLN